MIQDNNTGFNDIFRERTKNLALAVIKLFEILKKSEGSRIIGKQVLRSATSVAANFRAACRARSAAEYYSKLCVVIEECDETLFWLELIMDSGLLKKEILAEMIREANELTAIFTATGRTAKQNHSK